MLLCTYLKQIAHTRLPQSNLYLGHIPRLALLLSPSPNIMLSIKSNPNLSSSSKAALREVWFLRDEKSLEVLKIYHPQYLPKALGWADSSAFRLRIIMHYLYHGGVYVHLIVRVKMPCFYYMRVTGRHYKRVCFRLKRYTAGSACKLLMHPKASPINFTFACLGGVFEGGGGLKGFEFSRGGVFGGNIGVELSI